MNDEHPLYCTNRQRTIIYQYMQCLLKLKCAHIILIYLSICLSICLSIYLPLRTPLSCYGRAGDADKPPRAPNPNAFGGPVRLAAPLQQFLGAGGEGGGELARTEVTKLMWKYIKDEELQNPENRREILCDARLKRLFEVDSFTMFQLASLLKPVSD
jgi:hypothetical protein